MMLRLSGRKSLALVATTLVIGLASVAPASAQVKFLETFETGFVPGGFTGGSVTNFTRTNVAGVGVGGSNAGQIQGTFNPPGATNFSQMAAQVFKANTATAQTDLSQIFVSFDILVTSTGTVGTSFDLTVQSFNPGVRGDLFLNRIPLTSPGVFTRVELPLSAFAPAASNPLFDPNAPSIQYNIAFNTFNNSFQQNPAATHTVLLDNVTLFAVPVAVPEPGTVALLGMGLAPLGLALRRRRRN